VTTASSRPSFLASLNCDGGYGRMLAACLGLLLLPLGGGAWLAGILRYERAAIAGGQWWRLLTAHLVHLDARHALFNAAGLALLWALFARVYSGWRWLFALVLVIAAVDAGLWFISSGLRWYVGASALLHGVFACGAIAMIRTGDRMGWIALVVFVAKLAWEQWQGALPLTAGPVVTASHLYGAAGGMLAGLLLRPRR